MLRTYSFRFSSLITWTGASSFDKTIYNFFTVRDAPPNTDNLTTPKLVSFIIQQTNEIINFPKLFPFPTAGGIYDCRSMTQDTDLDCFVHAAYQIRTPLLNWTFSCSSPSWPQEEHPVSVSIKEVELTVSPHFFLENNYTVVTKYYEIRYRPRNVIVELIFGNLSWLTIRWKIDQKQVLFSIGKSVLQDSSVFLWCVLQFQSLLSLIEK